MRWRESIENPDVQRQRVDGNRHAERKEKDRGENQRQHEFALMPMEARAHEPPRLLDHYRRRHDEAKVESDRQLVEHASGGVKVNGLRDPRPRHERSDHLAGDEESRNRRHPPRGDGDDQYPAQRLEVLDHRHALLFDRDGRPGRATQHPVQQGHATNLSSWRPGTPSPRLERCRPPGPPAR